MTGLSRIICTALLSGLVSTIVFVFFAAIIVIIFFKNMSIFSDGTSYSWTDTSITIVCFVMILMSFGICPFSAYYFRQNIFEFTTSFYLQIFLFGSIATSQLFILGLGYASYEPVLDYIADQISQKRQEKLAPHYALTRMLDEANVEVSVSNAKILSDDGKIINAEITLQIQHVPANISSYGLSIANIDDNQSFAIGAFKLSDSKVRNPWIKATNNNGKWTFQDETIKSIISQNENEVRFQFEFYRKLAANTELPTTVTPRLGIYNHLDSVYMRDHTFYLKPIVVEFR
jgi:hypothetical protein